jgi:hypothetical protein
LLETKIGAVDPVLFTFPEVKDTGSIENGDRGGI